MSALTAVLRRCLARTPYDLVVRPLVPPTPPPPAATLDNVRLALAYCLAEGFSEPFVQIGACDGVSGDPVHQFIRQGRLRAVLVEPIEASFLKLRAAYAGVPNVTTVHAALAKQSGTVELYAVRPGAASVDAFWAAQLTSFEKAHLLRHRVAEEDVVTVQVSAVTLQDLMRQAALESIGFLQVDTEGFDGEVVTMALALERTPSFINFENVHLVVNEREALFVRLASSGYVWTHDRWNTLAVHARVVDAWGR